MDSFRCGAQAWTSPGPRLDAGAIAALLGRLPEIIVLLSQDGDVMWGNQLACDFFGRSLEASVGMSAVELMHPDDLEFALMSLESVQTKDRGLPIEVRVLGASGWRLAEVIGAPVPEIAAGALVCSIRDLTHRRSMEVAGDDVAKLRSLVHNAASLMLLLDAGGVVQASSGALARLVGRDPTTATGQSLAELVHSADRQVLGVALRSATLAPQGAGGAVTVEVRFDNPGIADTVPFELTIVNLLDDPTLNAFVVTGHDISARAAAEVGLRSALSLLSATLDATGDGILVKDLHGRVASVNRKFLELWHLPTDLTPSDLERVSIDHMLDQLEEPSAFAPRIAALYAQADEQSHDVLHFTDGRVYDRFSHPQHVDGEIVGRVWCFRDSTERRRLEAELAHQALHDPLTGLANQTLFRDRVQHALKRWDRSGGHLAVLFLDVDNFKTVNDSLGHSVGDLLLVGVTERIRQAMRSADTAARLGGDEFAILLEDAGTDEDVQAVAQRLLTTLSRTFKIGGTEVSTSVSIGIALAGVGSSDGRLLRNADLAMYAAKRAGKGRFEVYAEAMHTTAVRRLQEEGDLRGAISRHEMLPHYQLIVDMETGAIEGVEALARWRHPARGELRPDAFLPLAEETGLIADISRRILEQSCADLRAWQRAGLVGPSFAISVNLAAQQLLGDGLVEEVAAVLAHHRVHPGNVVLEITERAMMTDTAVAVSSLEGLRRLGVRIAVDDFGTGYSSLAYLQRFPLDILKIDKSFVDGIDGHDGHDATAALAHAIVRLAQTLDLLPIAEGVEHAEQASRLVRLGCRLGQGYHFARPAPAATITELLRAALVDRPCADDPSDRARRPRAEV